MALIDGKSSVIPSCLVKSRLLLPRSGVAVSTTLLLALAAIAAPKPSVMDAEPATPYVWRIVLHTPTHPLVTPAFRDQLAREVKAALVPAVGEIARVEVVDLASISPKKWEPLWTAFVEKGSDALESQEFRSLTGVKTHFLRVEVRDTGFHLEARQHDGSTGLVSPVLRSKDTPTADTVGRLTGLTLAKDFGPVGTIIDSDPKEGTATVKFRGGTLPGFEKFVQVGDVFAVSMIRETPAPTPSVKGAPKPPPVKVAKPWGDYAVLKVSGPLRDGTCECKVFNPLVQNPLPVGKSTVGYRCLKLATQEAPIQIRVVDMKGNPPPAGALIRVWANDFEFTRRPDPRDALESRDGTFRSARAMRHVACVTVGLGSTREVRFPRAVLGAGLITLQFEVDETQAAKAAFERDCDDFRNRVVEARTAQAALFDALTVLIPKGKFQDALERATAGLKSAEDADKQLTEDMTKLRESSHAADAMPAALLASAAGQIQIVRGGMPVLKDRIEDLKLQIEKAKDPVRFEKEFRAKEITSRIRQLIEAGDITDAIALYDQLFEVSKSDDAKTLKSKLEKEWEPKTDEVKQAREVVSEVWKKASTVADYKDAAPKLSAAADVLIRENDRLGLRNLIGAIDPAYVRLKEQADLLDGGSDADRATLTELKAVADAVRAIESKARAAVVKLDGAKP